MDGGRSVERRIVSVVFADLVGFTSLSERLDPEDVATVQDAYFSAVRETVGRYGGQLEKFIGDAAMAVFGIPRGRDDDAERAVRGGLALVGAIEQLSARVGLEPGDLALRVGINTGEVVYGQHESDQWRVTGDTVNVAARLQAAAPSGGVVIGEATALAVAEAVETEPLGPLDLKGKGEPVRAWLAQGARAQPSREHAMGELHAPILGREGDLLALAEAAARVAAGRAERWVVVAPPGVGKSRLLEEFVLRCSAARDMSGMRVWRARLRPDVLAPYEPVAQLFSSALAAHSWDVTAADAVVGLKATLASLLEKAGAISARAGVVAREVRAVLTPEADPVEGGVTLGVGEREQRFTAWLEALDALAEEQPTAWIVEDVHWSGGDLLAFLASAGAEESRAGRLVVATARPSILERAPAWCEPSERTHLLHLPPLSPVAAEALIAALVGGALPPELAAAVAERSDGNPLFIEELLRTWISVGTLTSRGDGEWMLAAPAVEVPLPATVQAIYAAQLDDLSPDARQAARRASVVGRRFPRDALEPLGVPNPDPAIAVLTRRALVAGPFADPLLGSSHQFRHALLRDAGYASLARAERARLHVRLASWLEQAAGQRWPEVAEVIGNHYRAALEATPSLAKEVGDGIDRSAAARLAADWFERAAAAAVEVAAHDAARTLLRQALDLTDDADLLDKARRTARLGDTTAYVADMDEGAAAFEAAAELFERILRDPGTAPEDRETARAGHARAITSLGLVLIQQLRFSEAVELAEKALSTIGPAEDLETAWLWYLRAWGTEAFAYRSEIKEDLERAMTVARARGDLRLELEVGMHLANVAAEDGTMTRADVAASDLAAARLASDLGDWSLACKRLRGRAMTLMEQDRDEAALALEEAATAAEAHALTEDIAWAEYGRTEAGLMHGDWNGAIEAGLRALDMADRYAYHRVQARTWFALSPIALASGRRDLLKRVRTWLDQHAAIFPQSPFANVMRAGVDLRLAAAGLLTHVDVDPEEVLPAWDESQGLPSWHAAVETIIDSWLAAGRTDAARLVLDRIRAWNDHPLTEALGRGSEALLRARLLAMQGDPRGATEQSQRALSELRACRAPWWIAKAIRVVESAGAAGRDLVQEAEAIERRLGLSGRAG